ncbi:hypothetical protein SRS16CHR_00193 [Variovorax sp. SRS16]|nr:hypothetical protein SRS16CHR_00193 [Variovorax sp. SRS16]
MPLTSVKRLCTMPIGRQITVSRALMKQAAA